MLDQVWGRSKLIRSEGNGAPTSQEDFQKKNEESFLKKMDEI